MKILRKGDEFVKMKFQTMEDSNKVDAMIRTGWKFVPKKVYKDFYKVEKTATEKKTEDKKTDDKVAKKSKTKK
jgi:hypothetical protein